MRFEKEKWFKFYDSQYHLKFLFMLYADFETILKPVYKKHRGKINQMKTERKVKILHIKNINTHVASGWCLHSTFAYGDAFFQLRCTAIKTV